MSARLISHGAVLQSVSKIRKEICRYDIDIQGLACTLYCCDCPLKRLTAAACSRAYSSGLMWSARVVPSE